MRVIVSLQKTPLSAEQETVSLTMRVNGTHWEAGREHSWRVASQPPAWLHLAAREGAISKPSAGGDVTVQFPLVISSSGLADSTDQTFDLEVQLVRLMI